MSAWAYYNEIDEYAAQWLRNLIAAGHIAPGTVDTRSIEDVKPDDLRGFTQCHFFAGIGIWSAALRRIGWPDDRPVWTGSCPCQPFSAAGKGGGFDDQRHLWPAWFHLITQCRPDAIYGEQVASGDGLGWFDLVRADLEAAHYAVGGVDLCAAGVGAPHIRQRLWFVAQRLDDSPSRGRREFGNASLARGGRHVDGAGGLPSGLDDADNPRLEGREHGYPATTGRVAAVRSATTTGESGGLAYPLDGPGYGSQPRAVIGELPQGPGTMQTGHDPASPVNGFWSNADWLLCRDGKWRPVEPGTFPLAHGAPARVGRLRAYGNAICLEAAAAFPDATVNNELNYRP